jgi:retinol dehydrogenase 12
LREQLRAKFNERLEPSIFEALAKDNEDYFKDRYNVSKLLEILIVRSLADRMRPEPGGADPLVIVNAVNPGLCRTSLTREVTGALKVGLGLFQLAMGRTAEEGSRTLVDAAAGGVETHGQYLSNCKVAVPSDLVVGEGAGAVQERVWNELLDLLEGIQPGIKDVVGR